MKLYFVRHGESKSNIQRTVQGSESPLTEFGRKQSALVAERVSKLPIDLILSSDYVRTRQTCEMIRKLVDKPVIYTPLLREFRRPSEFAGKKFRTPAVRKMLQTLISHADDPDWHYSDEENISDLKRRAVEFLDFVTNRSEENIVAVTHGNFLRILVLTMMLGDKVNPDLFFHAIHFFGTVNTGITVCEYNRSEWKLVTWNDHAHLAE